MEPIVTINNYPIGWEWLDNVPLEDFNWLIEIFATMTDNTDTYGFVFYEAFRNLTRTSEGFCEEMNVVYRTEELNTYLRYPKQQINPWHKHSTYIRLKLREILKVNLTDITIIGIISLP